MLPAATVEVALPLQRRGTLTYRISEEQLGRAAIGSRVLVPLGNKRAVGVVVGMTAGILEEPRRDAGPVREVIDTPDDEPLLTGEILDLTRWAADYYLCSWGDLLRAALPGGLSLEVTARARLTPAGRREAGSLLPGATGARAGILRRLLESEEESGGFIPRQRLIRSAGRGGGPALARLVSKRLVTLVEEPALAAPIIPARGGSRRRAAEQVSERPTEDDPGAMRSPFGLTEAQVGALGAILPAFDETAPGPFLLHGVTGSGKTEIYLRAIDACLRRGKGAIYLVPEIGLTPLLARTLRERFGGLVAILHSGLAEGERRGEWLKLLRGQARVAVGARSAIFAPVRPLGLVVVDEEQDPSYKQQEAPRYNGRDLALVRAQREGAVAILGTATPSLESWRAAASRKLHRLVLPVRVEERPLPRVEVVDLRVEFQETGESRVLSRRLVEALRECLSRREQAIVMLNRRGYSPFILCRSCGATVSCERCSVSLVLHRSDKALRCHYCGLKRRVPVLCPSCMSEHIQPIGEGTERAEKHLRRELPEARIVRMDSDTVRGRAAHGRILAAFERGDYDVLLGTQMVAKGHDFPGVTLVGVLLADGALGLPDFRAAERTFQLLTQVTGRAGRGRSPGVVIVQAHHPEHYAIASAVSQDPEAFYERELRIRRALRYPPFTVLAQVLSRDSKLEGASDAARRAAISLRAHGAGRVIVLGPVPAPIARIHRRHRIQLVARAVSRRRLGAALGAMMDDAQAAGFARYLTVDVDPVSLL